MVSKNCAVAFGSGLADFDHRVRALGEFQQTAWTNFSGGARPDLRPDFDRFCHDQAHRLDDYALAKKAAILDGYSAKTAAEIGHENLINPMSPRREGQGEAR